MNEFYNRHYITTDAQGRITDGWSDGPHPDRDTTGAICINEQSGYQFRLFPDGEENPALYTTDGIPLYRWDGEKVVVRTEEEIGLDRPDPLKEAKPYLLAALSDACNAAITAGCDVTLSDGSAGHISLTAEDQINLTNACAAVEGGAEAYPYHLDGQLCALYPAADILAMAQAATAHKLYHTTYYNHLAAWVRRCETMEEASAITYGADLPDDLAENMAAILAAAGGGSDAV
ncbi:MAG: hypothetical protein K2H45_10235 [Acetatifactor sp.]|nr:hypothetical protein [Acetatifactor sp.]